jgi:tetratricopeptide (TPR) repeat protein
MKSINVKALIDAINNTLKELKNNSISLFGKIVFFFIFLFGIYFSIKINLYYSIPSVFLFTVFVIIVFNEIYKNYNKNINNEHYLKDGSHTIKDLFYEKKITLNILNGKREGFYIQYFEKSTIVEFRNHYSNGKLNGQSEEFYKNGQLKIQSIWKNGIEYGRKHYYNDNGSLISESNILNGEVIEFIEYDKYGRIKLKKNGNNYFFFNWDNIQSKNIIICDISIDKDGFIGIWTNYCSNGDIEYQLDFDSAMLIEKKYNYNQEWNKIGFKVKKNIYNSNGEADSSSFIYIRDYIRRDQIDSEFSFYRFNEIEYYRSSGIKGPPGVMGSYIKIKPILSIFDLIEFLDETYFLGNDLKNGDNIRLVSKNNLNAVEFFERGMEKDLNSKYEEAIINFTKAIEIDNEYIEAYRARASARIWINDYEGVVNDYTKIIEFNFEDSDVYESRGRAKSSLKDYKGAIEDFNKAIELDKESKVYSSRGRMKKNLLDFDGALLDYNIAVEKYPEDDSCIFGRGELKYEIGDYHGAIKDFNKCIEIKPNRIMSFHKRGDCKFKIEDYKGAIEDYSMVVQNRQDKYGIDGTSSENAAKILASLYHKRGVARSIMKFNQDAIEDLKTALKLDPNLEEAIQLFESLKGSF